MLHEKLWWYCVMKKMTKWSIHSTTISQAEPEKELKLWCCPWEIMTALDDFPTK
jgi:hypothetical protein